MFDLLLAIVLMAVFSPLILLIYLLNHLVTDGKPLFFQRRAGKGGRNFLMIKFRSMNDQIPGKWNTLKDDPRVTSAGKFLRGTSLDELPQLINIFLGDMSFVGPRPDLERQLRLLKKGERTVRQSVPPGLTGLAQVMGRSRLTFRQRLDYDLFYARHACMLLDMIILIRTAFIILCKKGTN